MKQTVVNPHGSQYLSVLLKGITPVDQTQDLLIDEICLDSRKVRPGSLFLAVPGTRDDGRSHMQHAIAAGARAIVFDSNNWPTLTHGEIPHIGVPDLARKISAIADVYFRQPSKKLHVVGITGTNGKSSCAALTAQALQALGQKCAIVGTLGSGFPGELATLPLTTPDSITLQHHLAALADSGAQSLCLEVSSHSLDQSRTDGVRFGTVVFTNLTRDHLDYHKNEAHYQAAKARLFMETAASHAILNIDDKFGQWLSGRTSAVHEITYGQQNSDVQLVKCESDLEGLTLILDVLGQMVYVRSPLFGRLNGINLTTVAATVHSLGYSGADIEAALNRLEPIDGRMERIKGAPFHPSVYVDYAHTPDALRQALASLREVTGGKLWCVFGCGGDRDTTKRPLMGAISEQFADEVIITDDNPRSESPTRIANQIADGMGANARIVHDRRQAIELAIGNAGSQDAVLIAGKGHETQQVYADQIYQFSDRQVAETMLGGAIC